MLDEQKFVEAKTFLNNHYKAVFTVLDKNGAPSSSLMHYAVDEVFNIYIGTKRAFGKYEAMKNNPHVSLAVVEESADPLFVVDIQGIAEEIPDKRAMDVYKFFKSKNGTKHYVEGAEDFVMFQITPTSLRFMDARNGELAINDLIGRK